MTPAPRRSPRSSPIVWPQHVSIEQTLPPGHPVQQLFHGLDRRQRLRIVTIRRLAVDGRAPQRNGDLHVELTQRSGSGRLQRLAALPAAALDYGAMAFFDPTRPSHRDDRYPPLARLRAQEPEWRELNPGHWIACHLAEAG
jgi:hypothetical protein